jgi:hypothetical protein
MLFTKLKNKNITDIVRVGFIDIEDNIAEMTIMNEYMFIEFDDIFLKLTSVEQYSRLKIELSDNLSFDFEIDEDMIKSKVSVDTIMLDDTMADNRIDFLELYTSSTIDDNQLICDAISIHLVCNQEIFIDPSFYFGLNVGGINQKKKWFDNLIDIPKPIPQIINLSIE